MNESQVRRVPPLLAIGLAFLSGLIVTAQLFGQTSTTRPAEGLRERNPAAHALVDVRVVVAPGQVLPKATVVIRDGTIVAVGADVKPPEDARVWNLAGKTVYAGLIDAFGEQAAPDDAPRTGSPYWNPLVAPQVEIAKSYKSDGGLNDKLRSQGVTARLVAPSGGIVKGWSAVVTTGEEDNSRAVVASRV
ncbi:MAG TPA: hypothetical protein PLV92_03995, partial [Pirellulaceae bacterium]|nr:hypothetical protein [Pirellulaceae bacterium]